MLNVTETQKSLDAAQKSLNTQIDAAFGARRLNVVRTLDLASKAIQRAADHLTTAVEQNTKADAPPAPPVDAPPAAAAPTTDGKKK